ncbi:MAG: amidohydrolase family protein [Acidimicrobiales bacterium]|nr:amidohydrolase family protein [Acidimicrobiales bacterium]
MIGGAMYDLVLAGGLVVDGTGARAQRQDVGITAARVAALGDLTGVRARRRLDVEGKIVSPGFVDIHTHYDAQVLWDETLAPSVLHGVTTAVGGNCGFSVFPLDPGSAEYVQRMLGAVEGIPLEALGLASDWEWSSFEEWVSRFEGHTAINVGFLVGHSTLRRVVMGDAAVDSAANDEQLAAMGRLLAQGLAQGALGFSSSWSKTHYDGYGNPVPSRTADAAEITALCEVVRRSGASVLEFSPGPEPFAAEVMDLMATMSTTGGCPVNWNLLLLDAEHPETFRQQMTAAEHAARRGGRVVGLTLPTALTLRVTMAGNRTFSNLPGWREVMALEGAELVRALRDPENRRRMAAVPAEALGDNFKRFVDWPAFTLAEPLAPQHRRYTGRVVGDIAREEGRDPFDVLMDVVCDDNLGTGLLPATPGLDEVTWRLRADVLRNHDVMIGGSDAGAHVDLIDSFNASTALLAASREHEVATLEAAVRMLTDEPARLYGLSDRGRIEVGAHADLCVFDPDRVGPGAVRGRNDMPGGAYRLFSEPEGIEEVLVAGVPVVSGGLISDERPGVVLRSGIDVVRAS